MERTFVPKPGQPEIAERAADASRRPPSRVSDRLARRPHSGQVREEKDACITPLEKRRAVERAGREPPARRLFENAAFLRTSTIRLDGPGTADGRASHGGSGR